MKLTVSPAALAVGDVIADGKSSITVRKLGPCASTVLRGIPKIHVNDTYCYDSLARIDIIRKGRIDD